jgi:hypothetical protein
MALAIAMAMVLVMVQALGLLHGIVHAGGQQQAGYSAPAFSLSLSRNTADFPGDLRHSCAAFDEATLPAALHGPVISTPVVANLHCLALWLAFASWDAPFSHYFTSRAPPLS